MVDTPKDLEDLQVNAAKQVWKKYGTYILLAILAVLVAISVSHYISRRDAAKQYVASEKYDSLISIPVQNTTIIVNNAEQLLAKYPHNTYSTFGLLYAASSANSANQLTKAAGLLTQALHNTTNQTLQAIITLRLVKTYIANNQLTLAQHTLENFKYANWNGEKEVLLGDTYFLQNNFTKAKQYFSAALANKNLSTFTTKVIQLKLNVINSSLNSAQ